MPIWPKFSRFWLAQSMRDSEEARVAFRTDLREQLAVRAELTLDLRWTWSHSGDALELVSPSASERVVRFGGPVAEILRDADAFAADLIAVTTEGRNALGCRRARQRRGGGGQKGRRTRIPDEAAAPQLGSH